jgi:hypothetical protein
MVMIIPGALRHKVPQNMEVLLLIKIMVLQEQGILLLVGVYGINGGMIMDLKLQDNHMVPG